MKQLEKKGYTLEPRSLKKKTLYKKTLAVCYCNISNTRDSVSSRYPNTKMRVKKYNVQRSIFDEIRGAWIADETL